MIWHASPFIQISMGYTKIATSVDESKVITHNLPLSGVPTLSHHRFTYTQTFSALNNPINMCHPAPPNTCLPTASCNCKLYDVAAVGDRCSHVFLRLRGSAVPLPPASGLHHFVARDQPFSDIASELLFLSLVP